MANTWCVQVSSLEYLKKNKNLKAFFEINHVEETQSFIVNSYYSRWLDTVLNLQ